MNYNSSRSHSNFESQIKKKKVEKKEEWNPPQPPHLVYFSYIKF